ncbi:hypothetical protein LMF32_01010 [Desemzia sp. C1]|uniref:hypothetical protein n=1 Tax=Desemzia sp. C1 TaxID=2892016 RepID=UPI001E56AEA2|nr:hypothetical protein [Desemzia sp. C1]MCI3027716.1 hypothetical protein [Desemzia sp. C1]
MIKAKILDVSKIYGGKEYFENGEVAQVTASVDNGEGGYVEVFSKKISDSYRIYSGEYEALEVFLSTEDEDEC